MTSIILHRYTACRSVRFRRIENQEKHHKHESFKDEFRRLCKRYGLEIDERYVWDYIESPRLTPPTSRRWLAA